MSQRIIFITGANGALGQATARAFLEESPDNFVWLGVHQRREKVDLLASRCKRGERCCRCRVAELNVCFEAGLSWKAVVAEMRLSAHSRTGCARE